MVTSDSAGLAGCSDRKLEASNLRGPRLSKSLPRPSRSPMIGGVGAGVLLVLLPIVQWLEFGRSAGERLATDMAMPMGLMWCVLTVATGASVGSVIGWRLSKTKQAGSNGLGPKPATFYWLFIIAGWVFLTIFGNKHASRFAMAQTEYPCTVNDSAEAYESVVLLGGGVGTTPLGKPQFAQDGDRVRPVLQLWEAGRAKRIIVTGTASIPGTPNPTELTTELLISMGVPGEVIVPVTGVNTAAEMSSLKKLFADSTDSKAQQTEPPRRALVTSAFHMPRALRLADTAGLKFDPYPTAFRSSDLPIGLAASLVPTAASMDDVSKCAKELLASLMGR